MWITPLSTVNDLCTKKPHMGTTAEGPNLSTATLSYPQRLHTALHTLKSRHYLVIHDLIHRVHRTYCCCSFISCTYLEERGGVRKCQESSEYARPQRRAHTARGITRLAPWGEYPGTLEMLLFAARRAAPRLPPRGRGDRVMHVCPVKSHVVIKLWSRS